MVLKLSPKVHRRALLVGRYTAASVIAGVISQVVFVTAYGLGALPVVASVLAFVAGAVPNYLLNRQWAWRRTGRSDPAREIAPYAVIVIVTALTAIGVTTLADSWVRANISSHAWQVTLVSGAFLATYGFMFALKFVLFHKLIFARRAARTPAAMSRS